MCCLRRRLAAFGAYRIRIVEWRVSGKRKLVHRVLALIPRQLSIAGQRMLDVDALPPYIGFITAPGA